MSEKYIEKILLYFVVLSILIHLGAFAFFYFLPPEKPPVKQEPYMVELSDMPELKPQPRKGGDAKRSAERRQMVPKEIAPKGESAREKAASIPRGISRPFPSLPTRRPMTPQPRSQGTAGGVKKTPGEPVNREPQKNAGFFKPKAPAVPDISKLYPSSGKLSRLEEGYRKKYGPEVAEGEAKFLNTEDIQFGSFLRRFETAVYGVWRYPGDAARLGIEGVTVVKVTFNNSGEVEEVQILESSGSTILDDEVKRTLRSIGPMGHFPRGYSKDKFNLIAFFQYGIIRGTSRGTLH